ncbi:uncharacterized protein Fot_15396 [Forsythia ovata]|uniref:Uncharacterized protein n=1 Tax=Forsythia ovata TaxID=205694 RepID=A0ABD1W913_9LAMI
MSKKPKILKKFSSIIFISKCLRMQTAEGEEGRYPLGIEIEPLPCNRDSVSFIPDSCSEDDSVDDRAEKFIQDFYEEMRRQRQESFLQLQLNSMLDRKEDIVKKILPRTYKNFYA